MYSFKLEFIDLHFKVFLYEQDCVEYLLSINEEDIVHEIFGPRADHAALTICLPDKVTRGTIIFLFNEETRRHQVSMHEQIGHEVHHAYQRMMELICEQDPGIELPAYIVGYVTDQVYKGIAQCKKEAKSARKGGRSVPEEGSGEAGGSVPEVGVALNDGDPRQDSPTPSKGILRGAETPKRRGKKEANSSSAAICRAWTSGPLR